MKNWLLLTALAASMMIAGSCGGGGTTYQMYVTNAGSATVSGFNLHSDGTVGNITGSPYTAGNTPTSLTVAPGGYLLETNAADNTIGRFQISGGTLNPFAGPFNVSLTPSSIVMSPNGQFAYVAGSGSGDVSVYSFSSGNLSEIAGSPFPAQQAPAQIAITPSGNFLYVTNQVSNSISGYSIAGSGALTALPGSPFTTGVGQQPTGIAVSPSGSFLYVTNRGSNNFSGFAIDSAGNLTPLAGSPYTADQAPTAVAWDPSGSFLYVANLNSDDVSGFAIASDGTPTAIAGSPWATGGRGESAIAVDPAGKTVVALNQSTNTLTVFTKDGSGVLKPGFPVNTGQNPSAVIIVKQ